MSSLWNWTSQRHQDRIRASYLTAAVCEAPKALSLVKPLVFSNRVTAELGKNRSEADIRFLPRWTYRIAEATIVIEETNATTMTLFIATF